MLAGQLLASGRGGPGELWENPAPQTERDFYRGVSHSAQSFQNQLSLFYSAPVSLCSTSNNRATLETSQGQLCGLRNISVWTPFTAELKFPNLHANRTYRKQHRIDEIDPIRTLGHGQNLRFPPNPWGVSVTKRLDQQGKSWRELAAFAVFLAHRSYNPTRLASPTRCLRASRSTSRHDGSLRTGKRAVESASSRK
jgi:hypothetical protein